MHSEYHGNCDGQGEEPCPPGPEDMTASIANLSQVKHPYSHIGADCRTPGGNYFRCGRQTRCTLWSWMTDLTGLSTKFSRVLAQQRSNWPASERKNASSMTSSCSMLTCMGILNRCSASVASRSQLNFRFYYFPWGWKLRVRIIASRESRRGAISGRAPR